MPRVILVRGLDNAIPGTIVTRVFSVRETNGARGRAIIDPGTQTQIGVAVIALGNAGDLPRLAKVNLICEPISVDSGVLTARRADDGCGRAIIEPDAVAQLGAAVEAKGLTDDLTGVVQETGQATFVAVISSVFGASEADVESRRTVVKPGAVSSFGAAAVVAIGISDELPRAIQGMCLAFFVAIVAGVFGAHEADVERGCAVVEPGALAQIGAAAVVAIGIPDDLPSAIGELPKKLRW